MKFEWDDDKSETTRAKRGFGFEQMTSVFLDPDRVIFPDNRFDYGEERWITFGKIEGRLFAAAYTMRGETFRIVSARKANTKERKRYHGQDDLHT